ncbi:hypothetical protein PH213_32505 [Streptomyces sp. SRF1]|uniref:hypothetical protein n=1 Tax=Streptomyces sp. SRF1 TaxID=1549642 RepID=UPI0025B0F3A8|nr:hypothetical protein [Streptomyces sp. SRF1]MDN3059171.1 hypothetical protein [Streptomyces sp. SRF1]
MSRIEGLAQKVLHDLHWAGVTEEPTTTYTQPSAEGYVDVLVSDSSGMGVGFSVDVNGTDASILYQLADRIPDAYVELYSVGLPSVPGSHRPARPRLTQNEVVWEDPAEAGTWQCRVGTYPGTSAGSAPSA